MERLFFVIIGFSLLFFFSLFLFINLSQTTPPDLSQPISFKVPNPASVFCKEQGGKLEIRRDKEGNEIGYCIFEDQSECEEWDFYYGKCKKGQRFCRDFCGDGICQEIVCFAIGCPCAETKENCPEDCK